MPPGSEPDGTQLRITAEKRAGVDGSARTLTEARWRKQCTGFDGTDVDRLQSVRGQVERRSAGLGDAFYGHQASFDERAETTDRGPSSPGSDTAAMATDGPARLEPDDF